MSAQSVIKNFMSSLDRTGKSGVSALDEAVAYVSKFSSWSELINTMAKDCAAYNGDGENFLKDMCGIILYNADTGAITGSDAGGGSTKTAESIVPENGDWKYPNSSSFTISGLTVNINDFDNLTESEKWIVGALYTWWIKESLSLINNSYGFSFTGSGATVKTLDVYFYNSSDGKMAASYYSTGQKSTQLQLRINMHYYDGIDTSDPNGVGSSAALTTLDRTIAHELVHAVMSANVDYYNDLPVSFKEGSAELVHGIDDKRLAQIESLSKNSSSLKSAMSGSSTETYAAGYIALRYLAKQAAAGRDPSESISPIIDTTEETSTETTDTTVEEILPADTENVTAESTVTFDGTTMKIIGKTNSDVWLSGTNPFTGETNSYGNAAAVILDASEMTESRFLGGNTNNNRIIASNTGSTTWGGSFGDDILQGGASQDNFWYLQGCGKDTVLNYQTGAAGDILSFVGGGIANIYREQNNFEVLMNDGGTLTVVTDDATANNRVKYSADGVNVSSAKIGNTNLVNDFIYEGDEIFYLGGNNLNGLHVLTANVSVNLAEGIYSKIQVVDASTSGGGNNIFGDTATNYLMSGGNGSQLWGGAGSASDVLYGGAGTDIFMYGAGEGNDIINNAETDDVINFYNLNRNDVAVSQVTDNNIVFAVGSNLLTVAGRPTFIFADGSSVSYDDASK